MVGRYGCVPAVGGSFLSLSISRIWYKHNNFGAIYIAIKVLMEILLSSPPTCRAGECVAHLMCFLLLLVVSPIAVFSLLCLLRLPINQQQSRSDVFRLLIGAPETARGSFGEENRLLTNIWQARIMMAINYLLKRFMAWSTSFFWFLQRPASITFYPLSVRSSSSYSCRVAALLWATSRKNIQRTWIIRRHQSLSP